MAALILRAYLMVNRIMDCAELGNVVTQGIVSVLSEIFNKWKVSGFTVRAWVWRPSGFCLEEYVQLIPIS
jgi:hypothetical protein